MSGGASKQRDDSDEPPDRILPNEAYWLRNFRSMSVTEAIEDIKAIKMEPRFHLGDIFRTQNNFYIIIGGKKNNSGVFYYRIQGFDGTIRVRKEDEITARYGSPTAMPLDEVSQRLLTVQFPLEQNLDAEILTQRYIRRNEEGHLRGRREMIQISINAARSSRLAGIRRGMRDELASLAGIRRGILASHKEPPPPQRVPKMDRKIPDGENCSICLESLHGKTKKNKKGKRKVMKLKGDMQVVMLKCKHFFHKKCIIKHQRKGSEYSRMRCPNCRTEVTQLYADGVMRLTDGVLRLRF